MIPDYTGTPLTTGAKVEGWYDGIQYEGTVIRISPSGSAYRWITMRSDDGELHETFSDAVRVLRKTRP